MSAPTTDVPVRVKSLLTSICRHKSPRVIPSTVLTLSNSGCVKANVDTKRTGPSQEPELEQVTMLPPPPVLQGRSR